jgi:anti-sigma regulatory factor (Ser/Thr protein kinase)
MLHRALALAVVKATAPDGSSSGPPNCRESAASTESRFTFELQGGPQAITAARIALMGIEFDEDIAFDVRLMTAELVANSVEHAHMDEADTMLLVVVVSASTVRVEVRDGGAGFSWPTTVPDPEARGWGLALIEQIAEAWGSDQERAAAWFEVRRCAQGRGDASTRLRDAG